MSERMSRLCDGLRIKLHGIDRRLEALKSNGAATFDKSQDVLESRLDRVEQRIYDNRVTVEVANVRVKAWLAEKKAASVTGSPLWTERQKAHQLEARADDAETYAIAVFELAAAAADEATLAVLQALLARNDADVVALPEMGSSIQ
jgi:phage gp46-like protein